MDDRRRDGSGVEHDIVENCNDRVVLDGVEKFEFRFVFEAFGYCVGDHAREVKVKEVK